MYLLVRRGRKTVSLWQSCDGKHYVKFYWFYVSDWDSKHTYRARLVKQYLEKKAVPRHRSRYGVVVKYEIDRLGLVFIRWLVSIPILDILKHMDMDKLWEAFIEALVSASTEARILYDGARYFEIKCRDV